MTFNGWLVNDAPKFPSNLVRAEFKVLIRVSLMMCHVAFLDALTLHSLALSVFSFNLQ